ncbi:MAG: 50S ribosomal protein L13 [Candidatus Zambryskibacteria bacterium]|nr:50S ribosomal protein L13 [Candidatus Zambryskibacteria bacterium]
MKKHIIDAKGRVPGRVATEAAVFLMGKNRTDFARNRIPDILVEVMNTGSMKLEAKKLKAKSYFSHSGFPGNLKRRSQEYIVKTKGPQEVLRRAIYGMLPKNKLRAKMMKNLNIKA